MDFFLKLSNECSDSESDELVNYDKLRDMMHSVSISKRHKLAPTNSNSKYKKKTENQTLSRESLSDDDHLQSKRQYESQGKMDQHHKSDHHNMLEDISFNENMMCHVEKLKSRLDKQMGLSDHDKMIKEVSERRNFPLKSQTHRSEVKEEELRSILTSKSLSYEDIKKLGEFLFHHKVPLKVKLFICLRLESESLKNRDLVRKIFDKSMMLFMEGLLEKYCCTISVFGRKNVQIEDKARPPKDLSLLNPLTKLFASVACNPHSRYINLHITSLFINAVTFIASNIDNIQKRIIQAAQGKTLICKTYTLNQCESSKLLTNIIGLSLDDWIFGAYDVVLYGNLGKETNKNINEEIIKIQPNMNCTKMEGHKFDSNDDDDDDDVEPDERYITVARTKAPKFIVMYTEKKWKDHLKLISDKIQKTIKNKSENYFRNGDVVGFYLEDVELEHTLLEPIPLLRGLIVSQQRGNVMIWAMDIGIWVFARRDKLYSLLNTSLASLEALISIGSMKGPVCDLDEEFLAYSLSVLRHAALKNNEVAKKMFLPDAGENLLLLAEHHDSCIRHPILDILLVLTRYREGCLFLHERRFDSFITGKLEFWVHVSKSGLRPVPRIKTEIATMVKIISAIISTHESSKWSGMSQAKRALKILQHTGQDQNNDLFEDVLHQLEDPERKMPSSTDFEPRGPNKNEDNNQFSLRNYKLENSDLESHIENHQSNKGVPKVRESSALVYENVINVQNNSTTQMMDGNSSADIRPLEMAEVICGLLNNNVNGSIYFGLSQESMVVGILMNEKERKIFKKDIEIISTKFVKPPLPDSSYEIQFITVLEDKNGRLIPKPETYVVAVRLYPHKRVVYSLHDGTKYYTRKGVTTIEHNTEKKEKKLSNGKDDNCDSSNKVVNEPTDKMIEDEKVEAEDSKEGNFSLNDSQDINSSAAGENYPDTSRSFSEIAPSE